MLILDHLAVSASTLAEGVDHVSSVLGIPLAGGGQHSHMATHNRLLGLGDLYLEVIAVDPEVEGPKWPRWFDLDNFSGAPQLTNWVARCDDLGAELVASPPGTGVPVSLTRGDYRWQMAIPDDGRLPFDGAFPALIQWEGSAHPALALPDSGLRLIRLEIAHPDADALRALLAARLTDARVTIVQGAAKAMRATFDTPYGSRVLE
jgi:hypothetical protein